MTKIENQQRNNNSALNIDHIIDLYNKGYSQFRTVKYPLNDEAYYDTLYQYITAEYPLIEYRQNPFIDCEY